MRFTVLTDVSNRRHSSASKKKRREAFAALKRTHLSTKKIEKQKTSLVKEIHVSAKKTVVGGKAEESNRDGDRVNEVKRHEQLLEDAFKEWRGGMGKTWEEAQTKEESERRKEVQCRLVSIASVKNFPVLPLSANSEEEEIKSEAGFRTWSDMIEAGDITDVDFCVEDAGEENNVDPLWLPSLE